MRALVMLRSHPFTMSLSVRLVFCLIWVLTLLQSCSSITINQLAHWWSLSLHSLQYTTTAEILRINHWENMQMPLVSQSIWLGKQWNRTSSKEKSSVLLNNLKARIDYQKLNTRTKDKQNISPWFLFSSSDFNFSSKKRSMASHHAIIIL